MFRSIKWLVGLADIYPKFIAVKTNLNGLCGIDGVRLKYPSAKAEGYIQKMFFMVIEGLLL